MDKKRCIAIAALIGMEVWVCAAAVAQKVPTLGEILERLQENLNQYDSSVPSFFCDERVVSSAQRGRNPVVFSMMAGTVTDSTFLLKRIPRPDDQVTLRESREVKKVNGKPVTGDSIGGGMLFVGAFSNGLALVSLSQQACMDYTLKPGDAGEPLVVEFASVAAGKRPADCRMQEDVSGSAVIDPESMQVKRIQFHAPHHMIGTAIGWWDVTVEYAPVELDEKIFWLPKKISESMTDRRTSWVYLASYRHYHLMEATSRVLPFDETPAP
jgi:hypothetical protein